MEHHEAPHVVALMPALTVGVVVAPRVVGVTATRFYRSGSALVAVRTGGTGTVTDGLSWVVTDRQGTITATVPAGSATASVNRYRPFGVNRAADAITATARGFLARGEDLDGLVATDHRLYDPTIGRFLTIDPLLDQTRDPYGYGSANPATWSDPSGLCAVAMVGGGCPLAWPELVSGVGLLLVMATAVRGVPNFNVNWGYFWSPEKLAEIAALPYRATSGMTGTLPNPNAVLAAAHNGDEGDDGRGSISDVGDGRAGRYAPARELPRDPRTGQPTPDSDAEGPHTQLGTRASRKRPGETYTQAREFDSEGKPVRDVDFTDHGRGDHSNPHEHRYDSTTGRRGPNRSFQ